MHQLSGQKNTKDPISLGLENQPLSLSHYLSFCAPRVAFNWLYAPIAILQGIYAKHYGIALTTIAAIVLLTRIFDAITDPLVGYYSDRYCRQTGTRKPFILVGSVLLIISSYFLYVPMNLNLISVAHVGGVHTSTVSATYLTIWFLLFYLGFTLFDIPHNAWASELATSSTDKSRIYSFQCVAAYIGLVIFYAIPLLPFFESTEITPYTLKISVIAASILMLSLLYFCLMRTPNRSSCEASAQVPNSISKKVAKKNMLTAIISNKPLLLLLTAYIFSGISLGLWYGLIFLYVDSYLNLGEQFAKMFLIAFGVGIAVTPLWYKASVIFGRKKALVLGMIILIVSFLYTGLLSPGHTSFEQLLLLKIINTIGAACMAALIPAMLSEIVDYGDWKYSGKYAGIYFSMYTFSNKANLALGTALGLAIVGWFGYDATASSQNIEATNGMMLSMVWLPSMFSVIALILLALNPITENRHQIIRRRMDSIAMRSNRNVFTSVAAPQPKNSHQVTAEPYVT